MASWNPFARAGFFCTQSWSATYVPFGQYLPSVGPGASRIRSPSRVRPWVMNGSGAQIASTWPEFSAARIAGNGIATNLTASWLTLYLLSAARMTTSQTPLSAFPATVFPSRSFGVLIEPEPLTRTVCQLAASAGGRARAARSARARPAQRFAPLRVMRYLPDVVEVARTWQRGRLWDLGCRIATRLSRWAEQPRSPARCPAPA